MRARRFCQREDDLVHRCIDKHGRMKRRSAREPVARADFLAAARGAMRGRDGLRRRAITGRHHLACSRDRLLCRRRMMSSVRAGNERRGCQYAKDQQADHEGTQCKPSELDAVNRLCVPDRRVTSPS